ncbi:HCL121Cp [Eremothecium sinecaudum]|uniref:HCL121Cp n=1 Tax=Eremothecium sinecaudum TaxID=45286 RepID=A0A0X8HRD6_9SACH|nr:HCL121Cp [Eremothecium sinecaudum]AMD20030.1 HCL121Cp [Eremothecium sinecaudum]
MSSQWDVILSSLQDIYTWNEKMSFDDKEVERQAKFTEMSAEELQNELMAFQEHRENLNFARKHISNIQEALDELLKYIATHPEAVTVSNAPELSRVGKSYWASNYNPNEPIYLGSEVAYKPRRTGAEGEWFQCEVTKISADGTKFEVRDPEPDEFGQSGGTFKCNWKELLLIPPRNSTRQQTPNYPSSTKVLARYPETTTFYPAMVIGNKRDGTCRLRFDGEEEAGKETEVDRRFVLPFPAARRP